jgi:hypothetical protein
VPSARIFVLSTFTSLTYLRRKSVRTRGHVSVLRLIHRSLLGLEIVMRLLGFVSAKTRSRFETLEEETNSCAEVFSHVRHSECLQYVIKCWSRVTTEQVSREIWELRKSRHRSILPIITPNSSVSVECCCDAKRPHFSCVRVFRNFK